MRFISVSTGFLNHIGVDLDMKYLTECLKNLQLIWRRPVHIQCQIDDDMMLFSCEDNTVQQQKIKDDLPTPAHDIH